MGLFQESGSWQMLVGLLMRRLFFFHQQKNCHPQKLSCFRWKQVSTAMVPLISCHNPLPPKLPRQLQLQLCWGDLEGMTKGCFFFFRAGAWMDKVYPVYLDFFLELRSLRTAFLHQFVETNHIERDGSASCTWCWLMLMVNEHTACRNRIIKMFSQKGCCSEV